MKAALLSLALGAGLATAAGAEQSIMTPFEGSFDDATFAVESAIMNRGLVIDHVSHVGEMLNRTAADVGSDTVIFEQADIFLFCSAVVSRAVMEADPENIVHCPYGVVVTETAEGVMIGYRDYPEGPMDEVETLLGEIVAEAADG